MSNGDSQWEDGPNHVLLVPAGGASNMSVRVDWNGGTAVLGDVPGGAKVRPSTTAPGGPPNACPAGSRVQGWVEA